MEETDVVASLAALAQPMRLRVYRSLVVAGHSGETPGQIADALQVPPATLSFHLKELVHAKLVSSEREGRNLIYRASFDRMNSLLGFLTQHCCEGDGCGPGAAACKPRRTTTRRKA